MRRLPVLPTLIVALAVAAMIALGLWQIRRLHWKEDLLARYAANETLPAVSFPPATGGDALLFRKATAVCRNPGDWQSEAGRDAGGAVGWRQIARCSDADGRGFLVQIGIAREPQGHADWRGGAVRGFIAHAPSATPLIAMMFGHGAPSELMLVTDRPAPGLAANAGPDLSSIPNNHLAYAVQWFLFASVAVVIYLLALRKRTRAPLAMPRPRD